MGNTLAVKRRKAQSLTARGRASFNKLAVGFRSWYGFGKTARRSLACAISVQLRRHRKSCLSKYLTLPRQSFGNTEIIYYFCIDALFSFVA